MQFCLFLEWDGLTPSEWAAWAQAILSAVAIIVAARLATNQERRNKRNRVDAYVAIVSDVHDQCVYTYDMHINMVGLPAAPGQLERWNETCALLSAIPFHEVPDFRLYSAVRESLDIAKQVRDNQIALSAPGAQITDGDVQFMFECEKGMESVYSEVIEVSNELATPSLKQRWKHWKIKRRLKERDSETEKRLE